MRNRFKLTKIAIANEQEVSFTLDENGALAEYFISGFLVPELVALGVIVLIQDERKNSNGQFEEFWYVGRIIGLESSKPNKGLLVKVSLQQEWSLNRDGTYTMGSIQIPPSGSSMLFFPKLTPTKEEDLAPSLQELLEIKEAGLSLGMVGFGNKPYGWEDNTSIPYRWDVDKLDNRHLLISGDAKSGKTVFLKNLVYELKKHITDNRIILTDSKGDLAQLFFWDLLGEVSMNNWEKRKSSSEIKQEFAEARKTLGKLRLIVPTTNSPDLEKNVSLLMLLASDIYGADIKRISLRFENLDLPSDVEHLFQTNSTQVAVLLDDVAEGLKSSGDEVSLYRLQSAISRLLSRNSSREIMLPTNGITYNRSVLESSKRVLTLLESYFGININLHQKEKKLLDYLDFSGTVIFYLNHLSADEKLMWKMQLLKCFSNKNAKANTYLFFDEAHKILPKEKSSQKDTVKNLFTRLRTKFEKIARKENYYSPSLILSTQNAQELHSICQEYCATKVVMRTSVKNATHLGLPNDLAYVASNLNHGQFWLHSPYNGTRDWVRIHGITPPIPHVPMNKFWTMLREKNKELRDTYSIYTKDMSYDKDKP